MINLNNLKKEKSDKKKIVIIDGANLMIRAISITQKYHKNLYAYFLKDVSDIITKFKPQICYVVFDGEDNSINKRKIYPQYKMNRKGVSKIQTQDYENLFQLLKELPLIMVRKDKIEGDNVVAHLKKINKDNDVIIVSADQDFYQLVDDKTQIYNPMKRIIIDEKYVINNYNCHPKNFALYKCLIGDRGDNIPGVKGLGKKTVQKILPQVLKTVQPMCGDLDNLLDYLRTIEDSDTMIPKILKQQVNLKIYYKIIQLYDAAILSPQIGSIITQQVGHKLRNVNFSIKQFTMLASKHGIMKKELGSIFSGMRRLHKYKLTS